MSSKSITDLIEYKKALPLNVRVIRRYTLQWNPKDSPKTFFLLIDEKGNAIEARNDTKAKKIEQHISLYSCYTIDGYMVDPPQQYGKVVDQKTTIIMGDLTTFKSIPEQSIPKQYFNFAEFKDLEDRKNKHVLLTDYLCRIESASAVMKRKNFNLLKMTVIDLSQEPIEITLWEKTAYKYANVLSPGKIIAVTSTKVTEHKNRVQLESTPATTIDLELAIEGYTEIKKWTPSSYYGYQTEKDIRDNLTTLAEILSRDPSSVNNQTFSCIGSIKEFHGYRNWYSRKCPIPQCHESLRTENDYLKCKHHGKPDKAIYTYCVNATLVDATGILPIVIFDEAMTQLLGVDCEKLVVHEGFTDMKEIPPTLLSMIGQERIFHFSYKVNEDSVIQQTLPVFPGTTQQTSPAKQVTTPTNVAPPTPITKQTRKHDLSDQDSFRLTFTTNDMYALEIPSDIAMRKFSNVAPAVPISVVFTAEQYWDVYITNVSGDLYLIKGWKDIVQQIPIKPGYDIELAFEGNTMAFLDIYYPCGCNFHSLAHATNQPIEAVPIAAHPPVTTAAPGPCFDKVVTVRNNFRLPTQLSKIGDFFDGMKINLVYENKRPKVYKLRSQMNMVTYLRFTIYDWKTFARKNQIQVNDKIRLTYRSQMKTLFISHEL
ncbi:hypothetical protein SSX86_013441 [Deinandra increscens subsp. villosa]|uniref:Uncharacterized protein n=1 Tax=Deinandra increscens subsp. villosa TaxID=3103831 RepID=A0AAP0D637_9ASTR